jgi:uncharacterized membrane protein
MQYLELFNWWVYSISFSIVFLILVSIYLYANRCAEKKKTNAITHAKNFIFVWVLLGLLFFYIFSIKIGSALIFAAGNIVVEAILLAYLLEIGKKKTEETEYR